MLTILLTFICFVTPAVVYPLAVIPLAAGWPWLLARIVRVASARQLIHGLAMVAGTAAGLYLRMNVFARGAASPHVDTMPHDPLGGGIVWFIAITLGVLAYGLSTIVLGIRRQSKR